MQNIFPAIEWFQERVILREGLGYALQILPLILLTLRAFRESLDRQLKRTIVQIGAAIWLLYVLAASLIESWLLPYEFPHQTQGSAVLSFMGVILMAVMLLILARIIPLNLIKKVLMLLLITNYLLFLITFSKIYSEYTTREMLTYSYPYRLDKLLIFVLLLLITLPLVIHTVDYFAAQIVVLPSRKVRFWTLIFPISAAVLQSGMYIYVVWFEAYSRYQVYVLSGLFIAMTPGFIFTMIILELILRNNLLEEHYGELVHGYARVQDHINTIHEIKHEITGHLTSVAVTIEEERYDDALSYIEDLIGFSEINERIFYSSHPLINGIINYCMLQAEGSPVWLDAKIGTTDYAPLNDCEITIVLKNMLLNAVEELQDLPSDIAQCQATIDLKMAIVNNSLIVSCRNALNNDLRWEGRRLATTKEQRVRGEHGHGIALIQRVAQKHSGRMLIEAEGDEFRISIVVPIK